MALDYAGYSGGVFQGVDVLGVISEELSSVLEHLYVSDWGEVVSSVKY